MYVTIKLSVSYFNNKDIMYVDAIEFISLLRDENFTIPSYRMTLIQFELFTTINYLRANKEKTCR